jgi:hypothetical protein
MKAPDVVPAEVTTSYEKYCERHGILEDAPTLKWDPLNGCYFFWHGNLFVGIEKDGYLHT